ncbi:MAG: shikimate dehydrogenase [Bacteroidota bacterium]|nr:shikimate dehydrogenase [Bacteroidota bacterium]
MRRFGLIGYPLTHSFSAGFFTKKFADENIKDAVYQNFPLETIGQFESLLMLHPDLSGLNVTIPYKETIIPYLNELDKVASEIEAVNTIKFIKDENGKTILKGFNTDAYGFESTISPYLQCCHRKALILGTGGASKAVLYVLNKQGMHCDYISRTPSDSVFKTYAELNADDLQDYHVIVNTTPLGMHPNVDNCPPIPYEGITSSHILYDLIYNPEETLFLAKGKAQGATTINGLEMLHRQAEKSWEIWNK